MGLLHQLFFPDWKKRDIIITPCNKCATELSISERAAITAPAGRRLGQIYATMHENPLLVQQHSLTRCWLFVHGLQPSQAAAYLYFFPLEAQPYKISAYYSAEPVSVLLMISALSLCYFAAGVGYRVNTSVALSFPLPILFKIIIVVGCQCNPRFTFFPALQAVLWVEHEVGLITYSNVLPAVIRALMAMWALQGPPEVISFSCWQ